MEISLWRKNTRWLKIQFNRAKHPSQDLMEFFLKFSNSINFDELILSLTNRLLNGEKSPHWSETGLKDHSQIGNSTILHSSKNNKQNAKIEKINIIFPFIDVHTKGLTTSHALK